MAPELSVPPAAFIVIVSHMSSSRYTLFIVLYPVGVTGELLTLVAALGQVRREKILTLEMPNRANISFDYCSFLVIFALLYVPCE